ncbi:MAG: ATP-binding protein [Treponema sp.]|nr:ATP-binding protein [Treponema sp.]
MDSVTKEKQIFSTVYVYICAVIAAFILISVSSFFFTCRIDRKYINSEAEHAIASMEEKISVNLIEPEIFLSNYSEIIRSAIMQGEDEAGVSIIIKNITNYYLNDNSLLPGFSSIHGYFLTLGDVYISGLNWMPDNHDFNIYNRLWYTAAIEAGGVIASTEPYYDAIAGGTIISYARQLFDDDGRSLGIICLDINLGKILRYTTDIEITANSYGILLDQNFNIIAHSYLYQTGMPLSESIEKDFARFVNNPEQGLDISGKRAKNFKRQNVILFFREIINGWHLGIVIPANEYNKNLSNTALLLILLDIIFLVSLFLLLYKILLIIQKSDMRTKQKSSFLATISHEIRTPLNAILGMTEIQMQNASHPPSTSEAFIKINSSGNLLLSIINDLLDFSKIEAGKLELTPVNYEVASMINDVVQLNYIRHESKPVEFKLDIDENIPSKLTGDELRIKQILNNLLSNAFKYTDSGSVTLKASAECVGRGGGAVLVTLIFYVIDTGQGMTQDQVNKLFDEYSRFNMEANRATEGTGLGMTITRNLVDLMYGKIEVKSAAGEGTTVMVRLPQKNSGLGISGVIGKELAENLKQFRIGNTVRIKRARITHEYMPYGRILIVDDVETNLYVAKGLMAPYGLNIDLAASGIEAIEKIKNGNEYDIVFMDHMMPKMDGIEAAKILRGMGYTRPIVALTANAIYGQADIFLKNGFDGFISKPIDIRQLNVSLNRLIRDRQPAAVVEAAHREKLEMEKKSGAGAVQSVDSGLAEIFARDAEKSVAVMEACLLNGFQDEENIHMYVINVHAMKSALANIGEPELSAAALRLEQAGRDKNINVIVSESPEFIEALRAVIKEINSRNEDNLNISDSEDSIKYLREKLTIIRESCSVFDKKPAKNTLNDLKEKSWSQNTKELINAIAEHLLHSEFDNACALADEYLNKENQS